MRIISPTVGSPAVFWIITLFVLFLMVYFGWSIRKTGNVIEIKKYLLFMLPVIISFSVAEGLRYGRGQDFYHYATDLVSYDYKEYSELLYVEWIHFFRNILQLPYYCGFSFYALLFIIPNLIIIQKFPKMAFLALPLLYIIIQGPFENLIRQYFSLSFVLLAYCAFLYNKKWSIVLLCIISLLIHTSIFIVVLVMLSAMLKTVSLKIVDYKYIFPFIYIIVFWFWDIHYFDSLTMYMALLNFGDDQLQRYIEDTDRWFTSDGVLDIVNSGSIIYKFIKCSFVCGILYCGTNIIKINWKYSFLYISAFWALFFEEFSQNIELWTRFGFMFNFAISIIVSFVLIDLKLNKILKYVLIVFFIYLYIYPFILRIGSKSIWGYAFVWDL